MSDKENTIMSADYIPSGVTFDATPRVVKGGVFAPADIELIKRALDVYKSKLLESEESERNPSQELIQLANLLHRLNNRI